MKPLLRINPYAPQDSPLGPEQNMPVQPIISESPDNEVMAQNLLKMLRLRNVLQPNADTSGIGLENTDPSLPIQPMNTSAPMMNQPSENDEMIQLMQKLYQPENEWENRYTQQVDNMPVRDESNKPSMLRKILAGIYGGIALSPSAAHEVMDQPYKQQLTDWELKRKALEPGLTAERFSNTNNRQLATSAASQTISSRRADTAAQRVNDQKTNETNKLELEKQKLALKQLAHDNPNMVFKTREDGMLMGVNPRTGLPFEVGFKTTDLSEADKIAMGIEGRIQLAGINNAADLNRANVNNQASMERTRESGNQSIRRTRVAGEEARKTAGERSRLRIESDKKLSITQDRAAYRLAREQFLTDNPDFVDYFYPDGTPVEEVVATDPESYADAVEEIRYRYNNIKGTTTRETTAPEPVKSAPPIEKRTVGMKHTFPNGNVGQWDGKIWVPVTVKSK